jgi:ABC-2 type transport system ATP-binding protein
MIETYALTKRFDTFQAVTGVTLTVPEGEVMALLGPNGAGKTTTVRMLTSILRPTSGWARVAGHNVVESPAGVRRSVGVLTEHHGLYMRMRAEEYLSFFGELYGLPAAVCRQRASRLLEQFGMRDALKKRLGEYSKGMRQKLALIRAMLHDPPVLLLDEPTSAMDPESARLVRDAIAGLRSEKRTVILCTHNLTEAELLADHIAVIRRGCIIAQGSPSELKRQWLGPALFELHTATPLNGAVTAIASLTTVVEHGPTWVRYLTASPAVTNPQVLAGLARHQVGVVTLSEVPRSLEDVYLQVVAAKANELEK